MLSNFKYSIVLLMVLVISLGKKQPMREFKITGQAQGTTYAASYFAEDSLIKKNQIDSILNVIDLSMSLYKPNSTINQFNANKLTRIKIDSHMLAVLDKSFEINKETAGLFDITIQPLMRLWGFYREKGQDYLPDPSRIASFIDPVHGTTGMDKIKLNNGFLSKQNNHVEIDLNGIAQGYSVDVVADFFESKGIVSYMFELGGEIRAKGPKPNNVPIKIGIEGPTENEFEQPNMKHIISFTNGAVTTSGSYRKYIVYKGKNYGHIINPKTGYPISNGLISVTVFAKRAIDADGYDNALMLMSVDQALKFVAAKKDLEAYIIYKKPDGKVADTLTSGFEKMIITKL